MRCGSYDKALALSFLGIREGKYTRGRLERYVEGEISGELVGEIAELTGLLEKLAPKNFVREEDNFGTVISIQERSPELLKKFPLVN